MAPDADAGKSLNARPDPFAPLTSQLLPVGDGHEIYVETVGRSDGISAVYLHGGPGSGCQPDHRRLFDPERFHAVFFDQRGAGRSRPVVRLVRPQTRQRSWRSLDSSLGYLN
jgi:proline iminopeptidase